MKKNFKIYIYATSFVLSTPLFAATCTSAIGAKNWNTIATWSCGRVPRVNDSVVVPSGSTLTLDVNSAVVTRVTVNSGGILQGDGTGKILSIAGSGGADFTNNGTVNFSGAVGAAGSSTAAVFQSASGTVDFSQTAGNPSVWKFSTLNFNSLIVKFSNISQIEMNGHSTPFQNTTANITNSTTTACTWLFSGTVAQTISPTNISFMAGTTTRVFSSTSAASSFNITNTSATGLTVQGNLTGASSLLGSLTVAAGATLTLDTNATDMITAASRIFDLTSTVRYARAGTQNILNTGAAPLPTSYGNLVITGGSTKTPLATSLIIAGNFLLDTATTWAGNTNNPTVNIAGNFRNLGTFSSGTGLYTFDGSSGQLLSGTAPTFSGNMTVSNTTATGLTIEPAVTVTGTLTLIASAVMTLGDSTVITTGLPTAGTYLFHSTSTVIYNGNAGAQTVGLATYGNLIMSGGGTKTPAAGSITVAGSFTLETSTTWAGGTNNPTLQIAGNFSNRGSFSSGSGTYTFNGTTLQTILGTTTFSNLNINNTATLPDTVVALSNNVTVSTVLNFSSGRISTGSNVLIIPSGASVTGASNGTGWVVGNLQKFIPAGTSTSTFEVGTLGTTAPQLGYSPVNLTFSGVAAGGGNLIVTSNFGDHAQITISGILSSKTVNRTWTLKTSGVVGTALPAYTSYDATFNYNSSDLDAGANTANIHAEKWNASLWSDLIVGTRTSTSTRANGITTLGDFALGEAIPVEIINASNTLSDPIHNTSNPKAIPGAIKELISLISNPSVTIDNGSVLVTTPIDTNSAMFVNDIGGSGSGPILFTQGTPSSALSYTFTSLSSSSDDLEFSNNNGASWSYTPTAGPDGCDTNITNIRVKPQGTFASGINVSPAPSFQLKYRACVR